MEKKHNILNAIDDFFNWYYNFLEGCFAHAHSKIAQLKAPNFEYDCAQITREEAIMEERLQIGFKTGLQVVKYWAIGMIFLKF